MVSVRRIQIEILTIFLFICEFLTNILRFLGLGRRYYQKDTRLDGRIVMITGANSGIGKETTYELCKRGAKVLMCCRDYRKGLKAAEDIRQRMTDDTNIGDLQVLKLNLSSIESIHQFGEDLKNRKYCQKVDILINNAGVMMCPKRTKSNDNFELQFATNYLGHFLLTHYVLPLMVDSDDPRIINISSIHHIRGRIFFEDINFERFYDPVEAYCQSKLAQVLFTRHLSKTLLTSKYSNVKVHCLNPGTINTNLTRHVQGFRRIIFDIIGTLFNLDIHAGVQTTLFCALEPSLKHKSGLYYSNCRENRCLFKESMDDQTAQRLWNLSCQMIGIEPEKYLN